MVIRVDVNSLSDEVRESLERGEAVEIERDGEVVGRMEPETRTPPRALLAFYERRKLHGPVDDDFERDLAEIRSSMNRPIGPSVWE